jgi:hypothetical protein
MRHRFIVKKWPQIGRTRGFPTGKGGNLATPAGQGANSYFPETRLAHPKVSNQVRSKQPLDGARVPRHRPA